MSRVIFVTVSMRGGGTERVISILANRMIAMGHPVTIVMIAESSIEYKLDDRIETVCVSGATGGSLIGRVKRLWRMRKEFCRDSGAQIISMGTVANMFTLLASFGLPNEVVVSERNDPNRLNHRPIKSFEAELRNFLYKRADRIAIQTPDVLNCFSKEIQKKCVVIPNPLPDNMPVPKKVPEREKTILTAGRLTEQKNHNLLVEVFADFSQYFPEYQLHIFGRGELEATLKRKIEELQMQDKIFLRGFSDHLYDELGKGGMYVSTSDWEGISNSLLEALAMGIPTIATDCPMGGSRMCIDDSINGYLIPVQDKETLLNKMLELAGDEKKRISFSENAIKVRQQFSTDLITKSWL